MVDRYAPIYRPILGIFQISALADKFSSLADACKAFYFDGALDFYFDATETGSTWANSAYILPFVYCRR